MKLLIALSISLIVIILAENSIRKHPAFWYCSAFLISLAGLLLPVAAPIWLQTIITDYIRRGTLATALFILVMYARILPPKSRMFRTLMSLRAPLAIIAAFMILLHNGTYFVQYYENARLRNLSMSAPEIFAAGCTALMLLLLIPLTITSFTSVRKQMKGATWKKIQRLSYLFYALIYIHVACLFGLQIARGNQHYQLELAIYTAIFGFYLVSRVALYLKNTKKNGAGKYLRTAGIPAVFVLSIGLFLVQLPQEKDELTIETQPIALADANEPSSPTYQDGEWMGTAFGYNGDITVSVTIKDGLIEAISVLEGYDDEPYFGNAKKEIPQRIVSAQSAEVDTVSGATFSSKGIIKAVSDALQKAQS